MKLFLKAMWIGAAAAVIFFGGYEAGVSGGSFSGAVPRVIYSLDAKQNDQEIIRLIDAADQFAYFAVYTFTEKDIAQALVRARRRGVDVEGITDRDQAQIPDEAAVIAMLGAARIPVETQKHLDGIMHAKVLVTDRAYVAGSYNWTWSATNVNDEVLEIGTAENVREQYESIVKKILEANK